MAGVNRWHGIGNMTDDPKLSQGSSDDSDRCEFSIAINKPPGRGGEDPPPTYLDMICWGKLAGQVDQYGRKGRMVYVEGEIEVRKWETDEGEKRRKFQIKAYVVRFLDKPPRDDDEEERPRRRRNREDDEPRKSRRPRETSADFDDLPF